MSEGLKAGKLSSSLRNEFTRDVCSVLRMHTMNPTKSEREYVAFQIIKKFPFLADTMGSGIVSTIIFSLSTSQVVLYQVLFIVSSSIICTHFSIPCNS